MREILKVFLLETECKDTGCAYVSSYSVLDCSDGFDLCISTRIKNQKFLYSAGGDESMHLLKYTAVPTVHRNRPYAHHLRYAVRYIES